MLTDEELDAIGLGIVGMGYASADAIRKIARAVEKKAYERAAQECFERPYLEVLHDDYWTACKDCADAIRALGRQQ